MDKSPTYPPGIEELKQEGLLSEDCQQGQVQDIAKGEILEQRNFIHSLFGITV